MNVRLSDVWAVDISEGGLMTRHSQIVDEVHSEAGTNESRMNDSSLLEKHPKTEGR